MSRHSARFKVGTGHGPRWDSRRGDAATRVLRSNPGEEHGEVGVVPLNLLLQGQCLPEPGACARELLAAGVKRAGEIAADVGTDGVALLARERSG
jgi:hypothetical protein